MPGHRLIEARLAALAARLPADVVDELADGLCEAYERHLVRTRDPDTAAVAALAEFGDLEEVAAAFVRASPGRRTALALLATGPVVGAVWGAALLHGGAWTWPVPVPARVLFALALAAVIAVLISVALGRHHYRWTRYAAAGGGLGLITLDAAMLAAAALAAPPPAWPTALAAAASLTRIVATARALPGVIAG